MLGSLIVIVMPEIGEQIVKKIVAIMNILAMTNKHPLVEGSNKRRFFISYFFKHEKKIMRVSLVLITFRDR